LPHRQELYFTNNSYLKDLKMNKVVDFSKSLTSCCGKKWSRAGITLTPNSQITGVAHPGAPVVDFSDQIGLYFLYNGDRIVHHGSTTESLAKSLLAHTKDHFAGKWDTVTWFGFRPVNENGELGSLPPDCPMSWYLACLQAVIIKVFEPTLNTEEDISDVEIIEYTQTT
jgi:hypothetical protein